MILSTYQATLMHAKAYRILRHDVAKMLKPFQITPPEWSALEIIAKKPAIRGTQLAHELGVEIPMVTMILHHLEHKKLIIRLDNTGDKRCRTIALTVAGDKVVTDVEKTLKSKLPFYFGGLSLEDMQGHLHVLQRIIEKHAS